MESSKDNRTIDFLLQEKEECLIAIRDYKNILSILDSTIPENHTIAIYRIDDIINCLEKRIDNIDIEIIKIIKMTVNIDFLNSRVHNEYNCNFCYKHVKPELQEQLLKKDKDFRYISELEERLAKRSKRGFELLEEVKSLKDDLNNYKLDIKIAKNNVQVQNNIINNLLKENKELKEEVTNYKYELLKEHKTWMQSTMQSKLLEEYEEMKTNLNYEKLVAKKLGTELKLRDIDAELEELRTKNLVTYTNGGVHNEKYRS